MKKDKSRFTLRLNTVSPKHIKATDVLLAAGKGMSSLIADLIDERIKRDGENAFADYFLISALPPDFFQRTASTQTSMPVKSLLVQEPMSAAETAKHTAIEPEIINEILPLNEESIGDEIQDAILDGLSMFGSG